MFIHKTVIQYLATADIDTLKEKCEKLHNCPTVECLRWGLGNATDLEHHNLRHCFCEKSHLMTRGNVLRSVQSSKYTRLLVNRATMNWVRRPMPYLLSLC